MNDDRIDLSPLDPSRDRTRWNEMVASVASRALAARKRPVTVARQLVTWARPVLAAAAALTLVSWGGTLVAEDTSTATASTNEPAMQLAQWAEGESLPATSEILRILENGYAED